MSLDIQLTIDEDNDESKNSLVKKLLDGTISKLVSEIPLNISVHYYQIVVAYLLQLLRPRLVYHRSRHASIDQDAGEHIPIRKSHD